MIKAVIFDVGGVLALVKKPIKIKDGVKVSGVHSMIAKELKISLDQWFDSIDSVYADAIEGISPYHKIIKTMAQNNKIPIKKLEELIVKTYRDKFKVNKLLFKEAFKLKEKGYKIVVLSDQWHLSKIALMSDEIYKKFNLNIVSCDVGFRKPNPKIYKLLLKKLKVPAKNCLFIDNQEWNIKPAEKLGMKTILFENNKQAIKELNKIIGNKK